MNIFKPVLEKVPTLAECEERAHELAQSVLRLESEAKQTGTEPPKSFNDLCILAYYYLKMEAHEEAGRLNPLPVPKRVSDEKRAREYFCKGYKEFADAPEIA